jgi:hypothetical protein
MPRTVLGLIGDLLQLRSASAPSETPRTGATPVRSREPLGRPCQRWQSQIGRCSGEVLLSNDAFDARSSRVRTACETLRSGAVANVGHTLTELAPSYLHMHLNRLFRGGGGAQRVPRLRLPRKRLSLEPSAWDSRTRQSGAAVALSGPTANMRLVCWLRGGAVSLLQLCVAIGAVVSTAPQVPAAVNGQRVESDAAIVQHLLSSGTKVERSRAVLWFEPAKLEPAAESSFADAVSVAVTEIEELLGIPVNPSARSAPVQYFVSGAIKGTSHYNAMPPGRIFLALDKVLTGRAPYVHETVHHLIFSHARIRTNAPLHQWILEGFPSLVEHTVQQQRAGLRSPPQTTKAQPKEASSLETVRELLEFVGRRGAPAGLDQQPERTALFYRLSESFTQYLVSTTDLRTVSRRVVPRMLDSGELESEVKALTGRSIEDLRQRWLLDITPLDVEAR